MYNTYMHLYMYIYIYTHTDPELQKEKHLTCAVSGEKFPAAKRCALQRRQVVEAARHLRERYVSMHTCVLPIRMYVCIRALQRCQILHYPQALQRKCVCVCVCVCVRN